MKKLLIALILLPLSLWGFSFLPALLNTDTGFWEWRRTVVLVSGLIALWWMGSAMLLSLRPRWLEQGLGGLDKLYQTHKNIGIGAGIFVFIHWMSEWGVKQLAKAGFLPPRGARGSHGEEMWFVELAKELGEWLGYIVIALVILSLLKRIPYRYFRLVHKLFALLFIGGAFHGLVLMPSDYWRQPIAWITALVATVGIVAALYSLSGKIGKGQRHAASIESLSLSPDAVLEVVLRATTWQGHRAGQFLRVDFLHGLEGAHPFTIASNWQNDGRLTLAIKPLGDYTKTLSESLKVGDKALLEGPYGCFDLSKADALPQLWVAGGVGITPFLARLQQLAATGEKVENTDFFYSVREQREGNFPHNLAALCNSVGVRLHLWESHTKGALPTSKIAAHLKSNSKVWFCGPAAWGKSLFKHLQQQGLPARSFHRELFEFR